MTLRVTYQHTGPQLVATISDAQHAVREAAIRAAESAAAAERVVFVNADGDTYCYLNQAAADADATGTAAFAVISAH